MNLLFIILMSIALSYLVYKLGRYAYAPFIEKKLYKFLDHIAISFLLVTYSITELIDCINNFNLLYCSDSSLWNYLLLTIAMWFLAEHIEEDLR